MLPAITIGKKEVTCKRGLKTLNVLLNQILLALKYTVKE